MKKFLRGEAKPEKDVRRYRLRTVVLTAVVTVILTVAAFTGIFALYAGKTGLSVLEATVLIQTKFVGDYKADDVSDAALSAMVKSLNDRWSYYLDQKDFEAAKETRSNSYAGIGVTISQDEQNGIKIIDVAKDGPADQAGLKVGEIIRGVEGTDITEDNKSDCIDKIRGKAGTNVTLKIEGTDGTLRTVEVARQTVEVEPVHSKMLNNQVGYVQIENFYAESSDDMKAAVDTLAKDGAKALIFDVRNNPGGYVTELTKMLDYLLPEGKIFIQRDLGGHETVYTSDAAHISLPMAVLVNGDSYSAAEFFAAELQEKANAVIAGEPTCGKGFAQETFPLSNGGALGISTSRYFTGNGVSLIGTGLIPDPNVKLTDDENILLLMGKLETDKDPQLQAALKALGYGT